MLPATPASNPQQRASRRSKTGLNPYCATFSLASLTRAAKCSSASGTWSTRTRHIEEIVGEFTAIDRALERLQPGDLCLVLVDQVEEALAHLAQRIAAG